MSKISLNKCKEGDILISKLSKAFVYSHKNKKTLYPHVIKDIITGSEVSRLTSGKVYKSNNLKHDHDIVKIIPINTWIDLSKTYPLAYLSGDWDGLKSEPVLIKTKSKKIHLVVLYQGVIDGEAYSVFYDLNYDHQITEEVIQFRYID